MCVFTCVFFWTPVHLQVEKSNNLGIPAMWIKMSWLVEHFCSTKPTKIISIVASVRGKKKIILFLIA